MENKYTSLKFKAKIKPIEKINEEFTLAKCYVQGIGKNRNMSYMSKENVVKNSSTLHYAPVVGHLIKKEDGTLYMGGHDWEMDEDYNIKSVCVPYGVVTNDEFEFETVDEYGTEVEYMTAKVVLWTGRYPELMEAIYNEDIYFNQSMELSVEQYRPYEEDSNYIELLDWTYSALCMLGKADDKNSVEHTEPCFIESKIIPYSFDKSDFAEEMSKMKEELAFYFEHKGEEETMDEEVKAVEEEVVQEESISEEVAEEHEVAEEQSAEEAGVSEEQPVEEVAEEPTVELSALEIEYNEYRASHKYLNEDYEALEVKCNDFEVELQTLREFKSSYEAAQLKAEKEAVLNKEEYACLAENEAFKALINEVDKYSVEELAIKADLILAAYAKATFSANKAEENKQTAMKFSIKSNDKANEKPYGGIFDQD